MTERADVREGGNQGQVQIRGQDSNAAAKETPIPWVKLSTALGVRLCEAANTVLILPFMYKMVSEYDIVKNPKDGRLSDRIGRRPVLLMGLLGNTITIILFGFSKNFWWALAARSLNGICVGNSPVSKPVIAEMADDTNRTRMMALQSLASNAGAALGALIGGTFSNPVDKYPQIFGNSVLFKTYPYLLPCLISGSISLVCFVIGFFKFEETLDMLHRVSTGSNRSLDQINGVNESSRLLRSEEENTNAVVQQNKDITLRQLLTPTVVNVLFTSLLSSAIILIAEHIYPIFAATPPSYAIQITGIVFTATGFNVIASNVAPSRAHLGLMNSVQHGVLSFSKIVGPLISGVVWAWSIKHGLSYPLNYHLTFVMCAAMAIYSLMLTSRLPESVNEFGPDRVVNAENGDRSETS
ncbi:hypothetical protein IWW45_007990 [Coemansia sp. RSA 485]|nr:hypothetical protein IWW45_007990 [Coemansia sp. RSA 485]